MLFNKLRKILNFFIFTDFIDVRVIIDTIELFSNKFLIALKLFDLYFD